MSQLRVPDVGEEIVLGLLTNRVTPANLTLKLFSNDLTYTESTVEGDMTEATFSGYGSEELENSSFTPAQGDPSSMSYPEVTFLSTADQTPETIYGHYYVHPSGLFGVHKWDEEVAIQTDGDRIRITPVIRLSDDGDA